MKPPKIELGFDRSSPSGGLPTVLINDTEVAVDEVSVLNDIGISLASYDALAPLLPYTLPDLAEALLHLDDGKDVVQHELGVLEWSFHVPDLRLCGKCAVFLGGFKSVYLHERVRIRLEAETDLWDDPWTPQQFFPMMRSVAEDRQVGGLWLLGNSDTDFFICWVHVSPSESLENGFARWIEHIKSFVIEARTRLAKLLGPEALVQAFNFPPLVRPAAEQYLLYFAQFLADLGIGADVDLKHNASQLLFSVTPTDPSAGREALARIRDALDIYLELPSDTSFPTVASYENDIAVRHLEAQVQFLRSQLSMATATMQMKDAVIEALRLSNFQYRKMLPNTSEENVDTEPIISGLLSVTDIEGKGIKLHLAEIVRRLKRRF
jgi:hypothetical protein